MIGDVMLTVVVAAATAWVIFDLHKVRQQMRHTAEINRQAANQFREVAERWEALAEARADMGDAGLAARYQWVAETHHQAADKLEEAARSGESRQFPWWRRVA